MVLRLLYSLFIALLLVTFVGVGIAAFYPAPEPPEAPRPFYDNEESRPPDDQQAVLNPETSEEFQRKQEAYQEASEIYNRNVSIISLAAALLMLVASLTLVRKILMLSDGLMLGGLFTLIYSIGRGFASEDAIYRFIVVSIGLVIALMLGYLKFVRPEHGER